MCTGSINLNMQMTAITANARGAVPNRLRQKRNRGTSRRRERWRFSDARNRFPLSLDGCLLYHIEFFFTLCHLPIIPLLLAISFSRQRLHKLAASPLPVTSQRLVPEVVLEVYRMHNALALNKNIMCSSEHIYSSSTQSVYSYFGFAQEESEMKIRV